MISADPLRQRPEADRLQGHPGADQGEREGARQDREVEGQGVRRPAARPPGPDRHPVRRLDRIRLARRRRDEPRGSSRPKARCSASPQRSRPVPARPSPTRELLARRDRLVERFALMQAELGGMFYEMAIRDHVRMDVLTRKAAELQRVDASSRGRAALRGERARRRACPACGAPHGAHARFCSRCGHPCRSQGRPPHLPGLSLGVARPVLILTWLDHAGDSLSELVAGRGTSPTIAAVFARRRRRCPAGDERPRRPLLASNPTGPVPVASGETNGEAVAWRPLRPATPVRRDGSRGRGCGAGAGTSPSERRRPRHQRWTPRAIQDQARVLGSAGRPRVRRDLRGRLAGDLPATASCGRRARCSRDTARSAGRPGGPPGDDRRTAAEQRTRARGARGTRRSRPVSPSKSGEISADGMRVPEHRARRWPTS